MHKINAKLGTMRKAVDWVIYKDLRDGKVLIQSDRRIATFDREGNGVLSASHNYPNFQTLSTHLGAKQIKVPAEIVEEAFSNRPQSGDAIGGGVFIA